MTEKEYGKLVAALGPRSPIRRDCFHAFWVGGLICVLGQLAVNGYRALGCSQDQAGLGASLTLIALSALLTGFNVYDDIASFAGAGTLVPITGFANAVTSAAMEFKTDAGVIIGPSHKGPLLREYMMI